MAEYLKENEEDLNRLAKKALLKLGEKPAPDELYWLQLVLWALESGEVSLDPERAYAIQNWLDLLRQAKPRFVMDFMEKEDPKDPESEEMLVADPEKDWHPVDLAAHILDHLDSRMTEEIEDYPRANPLP